ncbi:hypothetical protein GCM10007857_61680 [Bradyrhizobium iriomotense]|uniref:Holliday junction resolvase n=1 Tax=Bradyrhizobium iriomotense TaxID=441950 RepID=A0ABQ6B941_9BRAD|nr:hypothetical protein GCM10007857_61680 [Bradyrhizobium iriomotense]
MSALGLNISKGTIWYCVLQGPRDQPTHVDSGRHRFNPGQSRPDLANYCKQTFGELIDRFPSSKVAYRLTLNAKSADQVAYLCFPFGILNLVAHERGVAVREFTTPSFTKKALGIAGDKFDACDSSIVGRPDKWDRDAKLAALSAWMMLDV